MVAIIAKVTEACNSYCAYCDVVTKPHQQTATMTGAVLECLYQRVNEYLAEDRSRTCEIVWHGGEPLMAGAEFFTTATDYCERLCPTTRSRINHCLQTNLTQLTGDFIAPLRRLGITSVGTSYDPIAGIRGPGREQRRSELYNQQFMQGVRILEQAGFGWGLIYVVTRRSLADPVGLFYFLTNFSPRGSVMFNPVLMYGADPMNLAITPEEYVDFLGAIFPIWWQHRERYPHCSPFKSLTDNIIGHSLAFSCGDAGRCHGTHLNVAPDGAVSQCGRSADWKLLDYGSLFNRSIVEILAHPEREPLRQRDAVLASSECADCRFWTLCHGGCPLDAWADKKSFHHKTAWCEAKRGFIEKYFEPITGVRYEPAENSLPKPSC